jgi:hypothetical protein
VLDPPIFILCRDRLKDLRRLVSWLEVAGHRRIVFLDCASSYMPLLEYLNASRHEVRWLGDNLGSHAIWNAGMVPGERFILTDPDIVPTEACPLDAVAHLHRLMDEHHRPKVGLGLYLDDVPADMPSLGWERDLASKGREIAPGVLDSLVDTTFALYEAGAAFQYEALRTGAPYLARHVSPAWYGGELSDEDRFYLERAETGPTGSSWKEGLDGVAPRVQP